MRTLEIILTVYFLGNILCAMHKALFTPYWIEVGHYAEKHGYPRRLYFASQVIDSLFGGMYWCYRDIRAGYLQYYCGRRPRPPWDQQ